MIVCPACKISNIDNTLFCTECGTYLANSDCQVTDPVGIKMTETNWSSDNTNQAQENGGQSLPGTGPLAVNLEIGEVKRAIQISLCKPVHIGRLDPGANIFPEIDLTYDGGAEKGVSRRHARIMKREQKIYVEDLGSSNGTFINGQKLMPYIPEALAEGDDLRLGKLQIKIGVHR